MSYKAKAESIREKDEAAYRGGALTVQEKPARLRYPCFADNCPMPGTIWPGITQGGTGDKPGECAWHYALNHGDIPRVTQHLRDWACIGREIDRARQVFAGPLASDPAALEKEFAAAVARLRPQVQAGGWNDTFERNGQSYSAWAIGLEVFLGKRVRELLQPRQWSEKRGSQADEELPWQ